MQPFESGPLAKLIAHPCFNIFTVLVYEIFVLWNHTLSCHFHATFQFHNSPGCSIEQFKPSKDVASLLHCSEKKMKVLDFMCCVDDVINGLCFWAFWLRLPSPGHQPRDQIFWLKFYWKLDFNPSPLSLIGFLAFLVQKLWLKKKIW